MFIFCLFQYGCYAKLSSRNLVGASLPQPTLFCFGLVWSNQIAGKMYTEMDIRRTDYKLMTNILILSSTLRTSKCCLQLHIILKYFPKIAPVEFVLDQSGIQSSIFIWCTCRKPALLMTVMKRLETKIFVKNRAVMVTIPLRLPKAKQRDPNMERERGILLMKRLGMKTFVTKMAVMVTIPLKLHKAKQMDPNVERERGLLLTMIV